MMYRIIVFISTILVSLKSLADGIKPWQLTFQVPATEILGEMIELHNFLMVIMTAVVIVVLGLLIYICLRFNSKRNPFPAKFAHNAFIEVVWTIIPVVILCVIAVPSFKLLKKEAQIPPAEFTIKVVGYQWYWVYQYPDHGGFTFDSYMIQPKDLRAGQHRLLEVDNRIVIPVDTVVRFLITGGDVIHSFAVPSFGIKTDAVPGRTNETWVRIKERGVYYGQCSELCGVNHGFMPIAVEVVSKEEFQHWITQAKQKFALNKIRQNILALNN